MKFLNFIFIIIFALSTSIGYAAKITDDTLTVAKPGSSANKELKLGTKVIRSNESTGRLEFSNDGTLYKNLGSGSGSGDAGVSVLENASYEDGLTPGWVSVGGTFTQETYINGIEGDTKYARHVASASGQYFESTAKVITDSIGVGCLAYSRYSTTNNEAYKISFYSGITEINFKNLPTTDGAWKTTPYVPVMCPAAGTLVKVRFESLAAGQIDVDKAYLGSENRTVQISSPRLVARVNFPVTASCVQSRSAAGLGAFPTSAACTGPTVTYYNQGGTVISTADQDSVSKVTFTTIPKGILEFKMTGGAGDASTGNIQLGLAFTDGTTTSEEFPFRAGPVGGWEPRGISFKKAYPSGASNLTIELLGQYLAGSSVTIGSVYGVYSYDVYLWPLSTDTGVTSEESGWFIDANIGGANPSISGTNISTYTEIQNSALDMVLNDGSAPAKIPCSTTNPATGLTCAAGNESVGVNFTPPYAGYFDVCANLSIFHSGAANTQHDVILQLVQTANAAQTILQEGKEKTHSQIRGNSSVTSGTFPHKNCGTFYFEDTSEKTIRVMYESSVSGVPNSSIVWADRSGSLGQQDIRIKVTPSTMNVARPVLTGNQLIQRFDSETTPLTYAPSSSYTLATLPSAPVGTYITSTFAPNSNTVTQTTVRPTQTDADMSLNGINFFSRAYNAISTAGNPVRMQIQIGKNLKNVFFEFYKGTGKATSGEFKITFSGGSIEYGPRMTSYNSLTGVLTIDAGYRATPVSTALFEFTDLSTQNNGYLFINGQGL